MCEFVSLLVFGPKLVNLYGELVSCADHGHSHSATETWLGLDVKNDFAWAKVEITPTKFLADFASYRFRLDEERKPDWWTDEHEARALAQGIKVAESLVKLDEQGRVIHWPGNITAANIGMIGDTSALTTVGGNLYCSGNTTATFEALTTVGGYLYCRGNTTIGESALNRFKGKVVRS